MICGKKLRTTPPHFLRNWLLIFSSKWDMVVHEKTLVKLLGVVEMVELMVLLKRIPLVLMLFTFKQNGGKEMLAHHQFEILLGR